MRSDSASLTGHSLDATDFSGGARQDLDNLGFGIGVVLEALDGGVPQVVERGAHELQAAPACVVALRVLLARPQVAGLFADEGEALHHRIVEVAALVEMRAAFLGDGVELLGALE